MGQFSFEFWNVPVCTAATPSSDACSNVLKDGTVMVVESGPHYVETEKPEIVSVGL